MVKCCAVLIIYIRHIAEADEMVLGLKCGVAELADHDPEWEVNAADTIKRL